MAPRNVTAEGWTSKQALISVSGGVQMQRRLSSCSMAASQW